MNVFMRADMKLPSGPGARGALRQNRIGYAVDEHDLAAHVGVGEGGGRAVAQIDDLGRQARLRCRAGEEKWEMQRIGPLASRRTLRPAG